MFWDLDVLSLDILGLDILVLDVLGYHRNFVPFIKYLLVKRVPGF